MGTILTFGAPHGLAALIVGLERGTPDARVLIVGNTLREAGDTLRRVADTLGPGMVQHVGKALTTYGGTRVNIASVGSQTMRGRSAHLVAVPHGVGQGHLRQAEHVTRTLGGHVVAYTP